MSRLNQSVLAVACFSLALVACGRGAARNRSPGPGDDGGIVPPGAALIEADPLQLTFDAAPIGSRATREVTLSNVGDSEAEVTLAIAGGGAEAFAIVAATRVMIAPGASETVEVAFAPTSVGTHTATLTYDYAGKASDGSAGVTLVGDRFDPASIVPRISFSPAQVSIEAVAGMRSEQTAIVVLSSVGALPLRFGVEEEDGVVTAKQPEVDASNGFSLDPLPDDVMANGLAPGEQVSLALHFKPQDDDAQGTSVRIFSNDPDRPLVEVAVHVTPRVHACQVALSTESLTFDSHAGRTEATLTISATAAEADGVCVLTSVGLAGSTTDFLVPFEGPMAISSGSSLPLVVRFVPTGSGAIESTLQLRFAHGEQLEVGLVGTAIPICSGNILRPEGELGIIGPACAPDQRWLSFSFVCDGPVTVESIELSGEAAGYSELLRVPQLPLNLAVGAVVEVGLQYAAPDWQSRDVQLDFGLAGLPNKIAWSERVGSFTDPTQTDVFVVVDQQTSYSLSRLPLGSVPDFDISVTVDGLSRPAFGANGEKRWTYDSDQNAVVFSALFVPDDGATLAIWYSYPCP